MGRGPAELEAGDNVFGLFVSAHLEALKTRNDPDRRADGKVRLLSNLASRGTSALDRSKWYHAIDWNLPLPQEKEQQVFQRIQGESPVTFIAYAARVGLEKSLEKGIQQGERAAFLRTLRASLKAKFGEEGEALLAQLPEKTPLPRLEELTLQVALATALDSLRPHFSNGESPVPGSGGQPIPS
jgi:hypothetical protein